GHPRQRRRAAGGPAAEPPGDRMVRPGGRARRQAQGPRLRPRARLAKQDFIVTISNEDVQEILRLLDTLPFSELTLETSRFTLRLQRAADGGWSQETQVLSRQIGRASCRERV